MATSQDIHKIFLDSNIVHGQTEVDFDHKLRELNNKYKKDPRISIIFILTQVVVDELENQYKIAVKQQIKRAKKAEKWLNARNIESSFTTSESKISASFNSALDKYNFTIIDTPYNLIDFKALTSRAIEKKSPFHDETDKGFKDGIISETVLNYIKSDTDVDNVSYSLITEDKKMREYVNERLKALNVKIKVHKSLKQLQSNIELTVNKYSEKLAAVASDKFDSEDGNDLFKKFKIREKITNSYKKTYNIDNKDHLIKHINSLVTAETTVSLYKQFTDIIKIDEERFYLDETVLTDTKNNRLIWETPITFEIEYSVERLDLGPYGATSKVIHIASYQVIWSSKRGKRSTSLIDHRLQKVTLTNESIRTPGPNYSLQFNRPRTENSSNMFTDLKNYLGNDDNS